jgi:hypothetical protein
MRGGQIMKFETRTFTSAACAVAAFAAGVALAGDVLGDMKVSRDKETGRLRAPTAEENAALKESARSLAPSVVVVRRPFTTIEVRPDGSAVGKRSLDDMENLVLTRTADGKAVLGHADKPAPAAPTRTLPKE